jgi:hypothetical protein
MAGIGPASQAAIDTTFHFFNSLCPSCPSWFPYLFYGQQDFDHHKGHKVHKEKHFEQARALARFSTAFRYGPNA